MSVRARLIEQTNVMPGVPAGSTPFPITSNEAMPATAMAQLLRSGEKDGLPIHVGAGGRPHVDLDKTAPTHAFQDDLMRKIKLRRVMQPQRQDVEDDGASTPSPFDDGQDQTHDKEDVNYRYSGDPIKSCGACKFFREPGACAIVAGMIRPVDLCDKFEPAQQESNSFFDDSFGDNSTDAVHATLIDYCNENPDDPDCQDVNDFAREGVVLHDGKEVTPPGYEPVVKALKKKPGIENPWAVAWSMKSRGIRPKKTTSEHEIVRTPSYLRHNVVQSEMLDEDGSPERAAVVQPMLVAEAYLV